MMDSKVALFDSANIDLQQQFAQNPATAGAKPNYRTKDGALLGEMMFGALPLAYKGTSTKIHVLKAPLRIVVTKMFMLPSSDDADPNSADDSEKHSSHTDLHPSGTGDDDNFLKVVRSRSGSVVSTDSRMSAWVEVEPLKVTNPPLSLSSSTSLSSASTHSQQHPHHLRRSPSSATSSLAQHRKDRSKSTSIEHGHFKPSGAAHPSLETAVLVSSPSAASTASYTPHGSGAGHESESGATTETAATAAARTHQRTPSSSLTNTSGGDGPAAAPKSRGRKPRFAVGIVISVPESDTDASQAIQDMFFAHFALFETHLNRLHQTVIRVLIYALTNTVISKPLSKSSSSTTLNMSGTSTPTNLAGRSPSQSFNNNSSSNGNGYSGAATATANTANTASATSNSSNGLHGPHSSATSPLVQRGRSGSNSSMLRLNLASTNFVAAGSAGLASIPGTPTSPFTPQPLVAVRDFLPAHALQPNSSLIKATAHLRGSLTALLSTPRIQEPLWLNMVTFPASRHRLCRQFMSELIHCVSEYDTRKTGFFLSTMLTAVLSHHLGWVPTVAPPPLLPTPSSDSGSMDRADSPSRDASSTSLGGGHVFAATTSALAANDPAGHGYGGLDRRTSALLETLSQCLAYNPLWAQLMDLYGGIGTPVKVSRTIVVGTNASIVSRLLFILTYFVRCSDVDENTDSATSAVPAPSPTPPAKPSHGVHASQHQHHSQQQHQAASFGATRATPSPPQQPSTASPSLTLANPLPAPVTPTPAASSDGGTPVQHVSRLLNPIILSPQTSPMSAAPPINALNVSGSFRDRAASTATVGSRGSLSDDKDGLMTTVTVMATTSQHASAAASTALHLQMHRKENETENDGMRPFEEYQEVLLSKAMFCRRVNPSDVLDPAALTPRLIKKNLGRSLLAGNCESYVSDFVLAGVPRFNFRKQLASDLKLSIESSVIDEPVSEAVCIMADTNDWRCELFSMSERDLLPGVSASPTDLMRSSPLAPAESVISLFSSLKELWDLGLPAETCLMHLEDKFQELYGRSRLVADYVAEKVDTWIYMQDLAIALGISLSDMPLLLAVAGTHSPFVISRVLPADVLR